MKNKSTKYKKNKLYSQQNIIKRKYHTSKLLFLGARHTFTTHSLCLRFTSLHTYSETQHGSVARKPYILSTRLMKGRQHDHPTVKSFFFFKISIAFLSILNLFVSLTTFTPMLLSVWTCITYTFGMTMNEKRAAANS